MKPLKFGSKMEFKDVDTNKDDKIDTKGYYMDDSGNYRLVYNELDTNSDGYTDLMIWVGSSSAPSKEAQVKEIATMKLADLNARDVEHAMRIIEGTARSMGLKVV